MKIKKRKLKKIIEYFLLEKKQKIDKKFLNAIVAGTNVTHNETGIEYTIGKNLRNNESEDVVIYRRDKTNPEKKIVDKVSYKKFVDEYSLV